jgi:2-polyprenyl-3-methyl-5-hydroxy-6-metoxy-1,4-benzoquinol methylase
MICAAQGGQSNPFKIDKMTRLDIILRNWRIHRASKFIGQGVTLLDIGTGDGAIFKLINQISQVVGVDPQIQSATFGQHFQLLPGRFPEQFNYQKKFDVITMLATLEHFPPSSYDSLARACFRFLKPEGRLIITVPSMIVDHLLKMMSLLRLIDGIKLDEHNGYDPKLTEKIFTAPFFSLIHHEKFQLGLNNLFVFRKMRCVDSMEDI